MYQFNTIAPFTFCVSTTPSLHLHFVSVQHHRSIYILCQYNTIDPFTLCISTTPSLHLHVVSVQHHRSIYILCQYNTIAPFTFLSVQHHRSMFTLYQYNTIAPFAFCVSTTPSLHFVSKSLETELGEALNDKDIYLKRDRVTQLVL